MLSAGFVEAFGQVLVFQLHVIGRAVGEESDLFFGQRAHLLHRTPDVKKPALETFAGWHQAARADDHLVLHHCAIHDRGAHADQNSIADGAAVQHDLVADSDLIADQQRKTVGVERPGVGDVQHTAVLHAGARADADAVHVASDDRQRPDRTVGADFDVADHNRRMIDKRPLAKGRGVVLERANGHDRLLLWRR